MGKKKRKRAGRADLRRVKRCQLGRLFSSAVKDTASATSAATHFVLNTRLPLICKGVERMGGSGTERSGDGPTGN